MKLVNLRYVRQCVLNMFDSDYKKDILDDIERHGVCGEYLEIARRARNMSDLISMYKHGAGWSLEHNSPSIDIIRKYAKRERLSLYGVFVDKHFQDELLWDQGVYVFLHCTGTIKTGLNVYSRIMPTLYFGNGCRMTIESGNRERLLIPARVPIYIYGKSVIQVESSDRLSCPRMTEE